MNLTQFRARINKLPKMSRSAVKKLLFAAKYRCIQQFYIGAANKRRPVPLTKAMHA